MLRYAAYLALGVWWLMAFDRRGEHILIETRYEVTCQTYEKILKRVPHLKVTTCAYKAKPDETEVG